MYSRFHCTGVTATIRDKHTEDKLLTCQYQNLIVSSKLIILTLQQNRLCRYGHVLWKEDSDWVKKCMEYEVESARLW